MELEYILIIIIIPLILLIIWYFEILNYIYNTCWLSFNINRLNFIEIELLKLSNIKFINKFININIDISKYKNNYYSVARFCSYCKNKFSTIIDISINTVIVDPSNPPNKPELPIVLIHGFAGAVGHWMFNLSELSKTRKVIAIDLVGFGRSSRPNISHITNVEEGEQWLIDILELWRIEMKLDKFDLIAHSLGGYIGGIYALSYPEHVNSIIFASPAGIPHETEEEISQRESGTGISVMWRMVSNLFNCGVTPQSLIRLLGPVGRNLVEKFARQRFSWLVDKPEFELFWEYIHLTMVDRGSTEFLLHKMFHPVIVARKPLDIRLLNFNKKMLFLYGREDWMPVQAALFIKEKNSLVEVEILPDCGHQLFLENPPEFNRVVNKWLDSEKIDIEINNV